MGYFQDSQTCTEHGFVLSPEGTCLRCLREAAHVERRIRLAKLATRGAVFVVTMLGVTAAWGHLRTAEPPQLARAITLAPTVMEPVAEPARQERVASNTVAATEREVVARDFAAWELATARADAEREAASAAQARAELQRVRDEAVPVVYTSTPRQEPHLTPAQPEANASWWKEDTTPRIGGTHRPCARRAAGAAAAAANGTTANPQAWGLPPNRGGYFTNRSSNN